MNFKFFLTPVFVFAIGCGQNESSDKKEQETGTTTEASAKKNASTGTSKQLFDIESAKIVFKYTGGPEEGMETLYFDDYGDVAVLVVDKKTQFGRTHQTTIWKDKKSIIIDHEKKTVVKSPFRPKATEPPGIADATADTRKSIGYEKMADESIAGKPCEVWFNSKQNIKYWLWNKVDLKLQNQGAYTKEATAVEETSEIPAAVMEIPNDYKQ